MAPDPFYETERIRAARWQTLRNLVPYGHRGGREDRLRGTLALQELDLSRDELRDLLSYLADLGYLQITEDWSGGTDVWRARLLPLGDDYAHKRCPPVPEIPRPPE